MTVSFFVPGEPVPKARARRGKNGHWYTPARTKTWEEAVGWAAKPKFPRPIPGPVVARYYFRRASRRRADVSNFVKAVEDGLNGVAWLDDSQVVSYHAEMDPAPLDERDQGVLVELSFLDVK